MKKLFLCSLLLIQIKVSYSQIYQTRYKVHIPGNINVTRVDTVLCDTIVQTGYTVKEEYKFKNERSDFTVNKVDTLKRASTYKAYKTVKTDLGSFAGCANIKADEKDKSILHLNYWLNPKQPLRNRTRITVHDRKIGCNGNAEPDLDQPDRTYRLDKNTNFYLIKVQPSKLDSIKKLGWYKTSTQIIDVYEEKDSTKVDYYLVDKYDRNADFIMELNNRKSVSFKYTNWDFGPLTIPFKYRFGYTKGNIKVDPEFEANLNVGFFAGYTKGRYRQRYEREELKDLSKLSATFGGFLNLSSASLDSISTTAGKIPFRKEEKKTIAVLSPGVGVMFTIYNFQFGFFGGIDVGFGSDAKNWNFNNRPWVGFGIGYDLISSFLKKSSTSKESSTNKE